MSFIKKIIENRLVQFPHRYKLTKVDGTQDTYDLEPITGNVTSVGTPVDKALLQRYEDTLGEHETAIVNKLDKTGDSKSNTVTFTEATADADISTGESHSILLGKIKKRFSTIATTLSNINTTLSGKAPNNHASTGAGYGIGNATNYGHIALSDSVIASHGINNGIAATPYAIKQVNDVVAPMRAEVTKNKYVPYSFSTQTVMRYSQSWWNTNPPVWNQWVQILKRDIAGAPQSVSSFKLKEFIIGVLENDIAFAAYTPAGQVTITRRFQLIYDGVTYEAPNDVINFYHEFSQSYSTHKVPYNFGTWVDTLPVLDGKKGWSWVLLANIAALPLYGQQYSTMNVNIDAKDITMYKAGDY